MTFQCKTSASRNLIKWYINIPGRGHKEGSLKVITYGNDVLKEFKDHFSVTSDLSLLKIRDINDKALFAGRYVCFNVAAQRNIEKRPGAQLVVLGEYFVFINALMQGSWYA